MDSAPAHQSKVIQNIIVMASGKGTGFSRLIDDRNNNIMNVSIRALVSNVPHAAVVSAAKLAQIPTVTHAHQGLSRQQHEELIIQSLIAELGADTVRSPRTWIVCAGYMRVVTQDFLSHFPGVRGAPSRVINIHPSLLPAYKGTAAYESAFNAGEKIFGCTVHFVTPDMDAGPIIGQWSFNREDQDTLSDILTKGHALEHKVYGSVIQKLATAPWHVEGHRFFWQQNKELVI